LRRLVEADRTPGVHDPVGRHLGVAPAVAVAVCKPGVERARQIDRTIPLPLRDQPGRSGKDGPERIGVEEARADGLTAHPLAQGAAGRRGHEIGFDQRAHRPGGISGQYLHGLSQACRR
jgi:hypothetical protein